MPVVSDTLSAEKHLSGTLSRPSPHDGTITVLVQVYTTQTCEHSSYWRLSVRSAKASGLACTNGGERSQWCLMSRRGGDKVACYCRCSTCSSPAAIDVVHVRSKRGRRHRTISGKPLRGWGGQKRGAASMHAKSRVGHVVHRRRRHHHKTE